MSILALLASANASASCSAFAFLAAALDEFADLGGNLVVSRVGSEAEQRFQLVHCWISFLFLNGFGCRRGLVEDRLRRNVRRVGQRDRLEPRGASAVVQWPDAREEALAAVGDGGRADVGEPEVAHEAVLVDGEVCDPGGGGRVAVERAGLAAVLEVAEDLRAGGVRLRRDLVERLGVAELDAPAVARAELAERAEEHALERLAGFDLVG